MQSSQTPAVALDSFGIRSAMIRNALKYAALLFVILSFGCSFYKTKSHQVNVPAPEVQAPEAVEEKGKSAEIKDMNSVAEDASLTEENDGMATGLDEIRNDTPPPRLRSGLCFV